MPVSNERARSLRCEDCAQVLRSLESGLAKASVSLSHGATEDLADARWLSGHTGAVFDEAGPFGDDRERTTRAFTDTLLVERTAQALDLAADLPGFATESRHLKNWRPWPRADAERQASERMYQFDLGACAHLGLPFPIEIAEPDLRIGELSIACKQPRRISAIPAAVRRGVNQVRRQTGKGLIAVSLQSVVDPLVTDDDAEDLRGCADDRTEEVLARQLPAIYSELRGFPVRETAEATSGILGVVFTVRWIHLSKSMGRFGIVLGVFPLWAPDTPQAAATLLTVVAMGIRDGDSRLAQEARGPQP